MEGGPVTCPDDYEDDWPDDDDAEEPTPDTASWDWDTRQWRPTVTIHPEGNLL
jgi:hypothetical protein